MKDKPVVCPDCDQSEVFNLDRRDFLRKIAVGATAATVGIPLWAEPRVIAAPSAKSTAETAVKALFDSFTDDQKKEVCFDWDHEDKQRGLLRTFVANNWQITKPRILSKFYEKKQQDLIQDIFKGILNPEWYAKFLKQLKDDTGGKEWGAEQTIAIFGTPGGDKFEFVMTGRHMTLRADGNTESHVAFGGPIFYGHAAEGFNEKADHPGNVFWPQAVMANKVFKMLDKAQQEKALVPKYVPESSVAFQGDKGKFTGIPVSELADEQKKEMQKVLQALVEPFRKEDQEEALESLKKQGGLDKCHLTFYRQGDIGKDEVWDNWRLEGPSFIWYFRGSPHVHVWVNVADDPSVKLNARG